MQYNYRMARTLQDMTVVITGASAGIGRTLAEQLSAAGARLVLSARRVELLQNLNHQLGRKHLVIRADVSRPEDCQALIVETHAKLGRIDTLVCNAGYGLVRRAFETSAEETRAIFATNVFGTLDCIHAAVPLMLQQEPRDGFRGQLVIISSGAARRGLPFFGAYSATKAAQLSLSEALRVELKPSNIAVTSVHPIGTETDFFTTAGDVSGRRVPSRTGAKRQTADHVAHCIVKAIQHPKREVWPFAPARWGLALNALLPGIGDRLMATHRRDMERGKMPI
jgi:short-subunit dehydrogenase